MKLTKEQRDDIQSILGEGFHTAFRKATFCDQAHRIWIDIKQMSPDDWSAVTDFVMECLVPYLEHDLEKNNAAKKLPRGRARTTRSLEA